MPRIPIATAISSECLDVIFSANKNVETPVIFLNSDRNELRNKIIPAACSRTPPQCANNFYSAPRYVSVKIKPAAINYTAHACTRMAAFHFLCPEKSNVATMKMLKPVLGPGLSLLQLKRPLLREQLIMEQFWVSSLFLFFFVSFSGRKRVAPLVCPRFCYYKLYKVYSTRNRTTFKMLSLRWKD